MDKLSTNRRKRGEVNESDIVSYASLKESELLSLLRSKIPVERSCAANLLQNYKNTTVVNELCKALEIEKKLYTKIALCDSLVKCTELSIEPLIKLLGRIGKNQETKIPTTGFHKISYPLPRDIAARTICRLGSMACKPLENIINSSDEITVLSQAIDAFGHIVFSNKLSCSSKILQELVEKQPENEFLKYKILRCLSGIDDEWSKKFLYETLETGSHGLRLEALRSLLLLSIEIPKIEIPIVLRNTFSIEMQNLEAFLNKKLTKISTGAK